MTSRVGVDVGVVVEHGGFEKRSVGIVAGLAFALGVVVGYTLKGLRIAYLKKKHDFYERQTQKTKRQLLG